MYIRCVDNYGANFENGFVIFQAGLANFFAPSINLNSNSELFEGKNTFPLCMRNAQSFTKESQQTSSMIKFLQKDFAFFIFAFLPKVHTFLFFEEKSCEVLRITSVWTKNKKLTSTKWDSHHKAFRWDSYRRLKPFLFSQKKFIWRWIILNPEYAQMT